MFSNLREDIQSIIERDPAARNAWEVLTCYPGLHAVVMHRWAHACWRVNFRWLGRFISYVARVITGIEIRETDGAITRFAFTGEQPNVVIPPAIFRFTPPAGFPVVTAMGPV